MSSGYVAPPPHMPCQSSNQAMENNNQQASKLNATPTTYSMPPPSCLPIRSTSTQPQTVRDLLAAQQQQQQPSPNLVYTGQQQQNVFQFSEEHFSKGDALAHSGTVQSPHPQVCSPSVPHSPHVAIAQTESKPQLTLSDVQSQLNLLQTLKSVQSGKTLRLNASDLVGLVGTEKLQEAVLSLANIKPEVSIGQPSLLQPTGTYQPTDNVSDVILSGNLYNVASMLQDNDFDTSISMDESILGHVGSDGSSLVQQNSGSFDLFEGDSTMNEYSMESQPDLPLSPNPFGNMSDHANPLTALSLDQDNSNSGPSESGASGVGPHQGSSPGSSTSSSSTPQTECHLSLKPPPSNDKPRCKGRPAKVGGPGQRIGVTCQICGKYFNNSSALAKHKLTHSDERKYVCNICSKAFKRQDHLNGHMMTHRSKKPFECNYDGCDKSYCDARSLRRHLENHHQAGIEAAAEGLHDQYFQFDQPYRQHASSEHEPQRSPSYLQQISPISPGPGLQPPSSPGQDGQWRPGYNPVLDGPKPVQCTICHRRFKNIPALNGHMRLHGGYFKKDGVVEESLEDKTSTPPTSTPQHGSPSPSHTQSTQSSFSQSFIDAATTQASGIPPQHQQLLMHLVEQQRQQLVEQQLTSAVNAEGEMYGQQNLAMAAQTAAADLTTQQQQQQQQQQQHHLNLSASMSAPELGMVHKQNYPPSRLSMKPRTGFQRRNPHLVLPSGNPISQNQIGYQGTPLNSPGPNSHPATPNLPLTPNHPITPNHPLTPSHPPHTPQAQPPLTPHTPHTQPPTPHTPHTTQQHPPHTPHTPHQPHTPHTPHTPSHTPITPNHHAQHFQFPPCPGLQESVSTSPYILQQQQQQQQHHQQQQQQQHNQMSLTLPQQLHEQQLQLQQLQLHELQLQDDQMQPDATLQFDTQLSTQDLEQQLQQQQEEQRRQEAQEVLQRQVDEFQHHLQQFKEQEQQQQPQQHQQQTVPFDFDDALVSDPGGGTQVHFDSVSLENSLKPENSKLDVFFCKLRPQDTALHERKRRASADPDKFMQPKRPFYVSELLSDGNVNNVSSSDHSKDGHEETAAPSKRSSTTSSDNATFLAPPPRVESGVFRNPALLPSSPLKVRRKHRPEPLVIPPQLNNFGFPSRLRSPRLWDGPKPRTTPPPYTPPPMLSPLRSGSGLFWTLHSSTYRPITPQSAPIIPKLIRKVSISGSTSHPLAEARPASSDGEEEEPEEEPEVEEPPPETDILPHVNIGSRYQTELPPLKENRLDALAEVEKETLVWDPLVMDDLTEEELQYYQDFACCAAIPGNGCNKEYALHLLHMCKGSVKQAMLKLMQGEPKMPPDSTLRTYTYQESDVWSAEEIEAYHNAMVKCDKDFFNIANEIGSKTVKQCIQFYYLWKKVCAEEYKRLRIVRRKREQEELYNLRSKAQAQQQQADSQADKATSPSLSTADDGQYVCEFADCDATFNSKQALNGHVRIHGGGGRERERSPKPSAPPHQGTPSPVSITSEDNDLADVSGFPCKICGRVFSKVKSRNAHMKSHRQMEPAERARWTAITSADTHI